MSSKRKGRSVSAAATQQDTSAPSASASDSLSDAACAHCRDRKVRCDRRKPQCSNCREAGVDCGYTAPGKRVNHIKLLCETVGSVEHRMKGLERRLQAIASAGAIHTHGAAPVCAPAPTAVMVGPHTLTPPYDSDGSDASPSKRNRSAPAQSDVPNMPLDRYVRSNSHDSGESYHGPGSLVDLCHDFRSSVLDGMTSQRDSHAAPNDSDTRHLQEVDSRLEELCEEASDNSLVGKTTTSPSEDLVTALPPKPVVLAAAAQFFQQVDHVTDIFDETSFYANLDRVYAEPFADASWAICCRVIILLVCATELVTRGNQSLLGGLARPYLTDGLSAVAYRRLGTAPRLINVQTLILLSLCAQQFDPPGWSELLFGQACLLSRTMGLHQLQTGPHNAPNGQTDQVDRCKVLRSLYLRDKKLALQRGCACWLPLHDCSLPSDFGLTAASDVNGSLSAHLQLASIQDDLYRLIHAADARRQSHHKTSRLFARINQGLSELSRAPLWIDEDAPRTRNIAFKLDFLASRICAASCSTNEGCSEAMLGDSIASCLFLLAGCGQHDASLVEPLVRLLPTELGPQHRADVTGVTFASPDQSQPLAVHASLVSFSLHAFLLLAKQLMPRTSTLKPKEKDTILYMLQKVAACYRDNQSIFESQNLCRNLGKVFQQVLQIVDMVQNPRETEDFATLSEARDQCMHHDTLPMDFTSGDVGDASNFALPASEPWTSPMSTSWDTNFLNDVSMAHLGLDEAFAKSFPDDVNDPLNYMPGLY